ncbi:MAG: TrkA C-terminal domain-containing protein, partial [Acidimicrobiales bacterium]
AMVWLIEQKEELHPILAVALGESDEVVVRVPVAPGSRADGATLGDLRLDVEPGFHVLAVRRDDRYLYRPRGHVALQPGDELIASGPDEGHPDLAELCGWRLVEDEDTGEQDLRPLERV